MEGTRRLAPSSLLIRAARILFTFNLRATLIRHPGEIREKSAWLPATARKN